MDTGIALTEGILEGDIESIIIALIPFALAVWWFLHVHILPARRRRQPSEPKERTYFYRKRKVTEEEKWPRKSSWRKGGVRKGVGGPPNAGHSIWLPEGGSGDRDWCKCKKECVRHGAKTRTVLH